MDVRLPETKPLTIPALRRAFVGNDKQGIAYIWKPRLPDNWDTVVDGVEAALDKLAKALTIEAKMVEHDRGDFPCFNFGTSYGGGQKVGVSQLTYKARPDLAYSMLPGRLLRPSG